MSRARSPRLREPKRTLIAVRLPGSVVNALRRKAARTHFSMTRHVEIALRAYLDLPSFETRYFRRQWAAARQRGRA